MGQNFYVATFAQGDDNAQSYFKIKDDVVDVDPIAVAMATIIGQFPGATCLKRSVGKSLAYDPSAAPDSEDAVDYMAVVLMAYDDANNGELTFKLRCPHIPESDWPNATDVATWFDTNKASIYAPNGTNPTRLIKYSKVTMRKGRR